MPPDEQGIIVLGSLVGQEAFIMAQLSAKREEHQVLLDRIQCVSDAQTAWLLLLFCGATRANYWIRTVSPDSLEVLRKSVTSSDAMFGKDHARGPFLDPPVRARSCHIVLGRIGHRISVPSVCSLGQLGRLFCNGQGAPPHCRCQTSVVGRRSPSGFCTRGCPGPAPLWVATRSVLESRTTLQRHAAVANNDRARSSSVTLTRRPSGGAPFTSCPTDRLFRIEPQCFCVLLLRRLRLPLPLSQRNCRCVRPLNILGHHCCAMAGVGRRGLRRFERGGFDRLDGRRLEVVADGLHSSEARNLPLTPPS